MRIPCLTLTTSVKFASTERTALEKTLNRTFGGEIPIEDADSFKTGIAHLPQTRRSDGFMQASRKLKEQVETRFPGITLQQSRLTGTGWGGIGDFDVYNLTYQDRITGEQKAKRVSLEHPRCHLFNRLHVMREAKALYRQLQAVTRQ